MLANYLCSRSYWLSRFLTLLVLDCIVNDQDLGFESGKDLGAIARGGSVLKSAGPQWQTSCCISCGSNLSISHLDQFLLVKEGLQMACQLELETSGSRTGGSKSSQTLPTNMHRQRECNPVEHRMSLHFLELTVPFAKGSPGLSFSWLVPIRSILQAPV